MTKKELVSLVSKDTKVSSKQISEILDKFLDVLVETASKEDRVHVSIGTFTVVERAARVGRNPQNGKPIQIPKSTTLKFKASKAVKDLLNK